MKPNCIRYLLAGIFILVSSFVQAGTFAVVDLTVKERQGDAIKVVTTVDLANPSSFPILFPDDKKPWICSISSTWMKGELTDTLFLSFSDASILIEDEGKKEPLTIFRSSFRNGWGAGEEFSVFRSGSVSVSIRVTPLQDQSQGEQASAGQPATVSESKSEGADQPQPEAEGRSR